MDDDNTYMARALEEAKAAAGRDEVPVGAVLINTDTGEIIASAGNRTREHNDPSAHAEILVIREACMQTGAQRIPRHDLYVTLEPCAMCAGAISFARINRVVIAADDPKGGAVFNGPKFFDQLTCHWRPEIEKGPYADESAELLRSFFRSKRAKA